MKKLSAVFMVVGCLALVGCSVTNKISLGGEAELFHVTSWDLFSPNTVAFYQIDKETGHVIMVNGGIGASSLGTIAGPAAVAYAGNQLKKGLRDSGDENNTEISNEAAGGESASSSHGGNATGGAGGDAISNSTSRGGNAAAGAISGSSSSSSSRSSSSSNARATGGSPCRGRGCK
jgi:hypothetical protein